MYVCYTKDLTTSIWKSKSGFKSENVEFLKGKTEMERGDKESEFQLK